MDHTFLSGEEGEKPYPFHCSTAMAYTELPPSIQYHSREEKRGVTPQKPRVRAAARTFVASTEKALFSFFVSQKLAAISSTQQCHTIQRLDWSSSQ